MVVLSRVDTGLLQGGTVIVDKRDAFYRGILTSECKVVVPRPRDRHVPGTVGETSGSGARHHGDAVDDGIEPDTAEYFRYIEKRLGFKQDEYGGSPMSSAAKPSSRQSPPPSAPVNRDTGRTNVAHLTRAQADTAKALGMTEKEYATHMMALQKEGRLAH